jgi:hypothetical protein
MCLLPGSDSSYYVYVIPLGYISPRRLTRGPSTLVIAKRQSTRDVYGAQFFGPLETPRLRVILPPHVGFRPVRCTAGKYGQKYNGLHNKRVTSHCRLLPSLWVLVYPSYPRSICFCSAGRSALTLTLECVSFVTNGLSICIYNPQWLI